MARNSEKQYGKLNRLILAKEKEDFNLKFPKRPKLHHLSTVDDIKQWLPSIKRDIDFNLKQSQVICYSDSKIDEYRNNVTSLEHEYKRFVRKLKQLDANIKDIPWTDRPYEPKQIILSEEAVHQIQPAIQTPRIETPILCSSQTLDSDSVVLNCRTETQDAPLDFKEIPTKSLAKDNFEKLCQPQKRKYEFCYSDEAYLNTELKLKRIFGLDTT